ncbi:DUF4231 domain-containing protein [Mycoplasma buteonis]|uniref:DUF4231 domain-containing protein n=1 Tax=Mycoplasma buteonis TaxID=171280 RepID=UPI00056219E0|nr:DUF4231 domain-containing protein [Mycoplasma buteonis]
MSKAYSEYLKVKKRLKAQVWTYGFLYYLLNFTTIFAAFYIALLAVLFLAGANTNYIEENPYKDAQFLHSSGVYVIFTTIINSIVGLISGILSFFLINNKFQSKKVQLKKLEFEEIAFRSNLGNYSNFHSQKEKEYYLYKRTLVHIQFERYHTEIIKGDSFYDSK